MQGFFCGFLEAFLIHNNKEKMIMRHVIYVFLGACSYGVLSTIVKLAYNQGYSLGEVVGTQMLWGTLITWIFSAMMQRKAKAKLQAENRNKQIILPIKATLKEKFQLSAVGSFTVITGLLYYGSLQHINASLAIILLFQFTWIGVLLEAISKRQWPSKLQLTTLLVLFIGTGLAAGISKNGIASAPLIGVVLGLLSAVSYTLFIFFSGKTVPRLDPIYRSAWMSTGGLLFVFILFPPLYLFNGTLEITLLFFGLLLGLFGAVIPTICFTIGIPKIGTGFASILGSAELPVAMICSTLLLHEHVLLLQWVGVVLILISISLPRLKI
jgi:drug/metabolite transporter (DMT)-like permease